MNRRIALLSAVACLAIFVSDGSAYQIATASDDQPAAAVPSLKDLEQAVQNLQDECTAQAGSPECVPSHEPLAMEPVVYPRQPISTQCRVITAVVHFSRQRVACDEGPDLWYTIGFFQDPTDQRTYHFRFNDMGAAAGGNETPSVYVVVFRPSDRELSESDINAFIPVSWVKEQSQSQAK